MIYIKNIPTEQCFLIPKNTPMTLDSYEFSAVSTIDRLPLMVASATVTDYSANYYKVKLLISSAPNIGEYEYQIYNGKEVVATGLLILQAADNKEVVVDYETEIKYIQYE